MILDAIRLEQHGHRFYMVKIMAKDLVNERKVKVDIWRREHDEGYQRKAAPARGNAFASFIRNPKSVSPASVLLSVRGKVTYRAIKGSHGTLEIPDRECLWIIDGQHRIEGLKILIKKNPSRGTLEVPAIIFPLKDRYEEAKQFVIINRTQKGVKADLAERFLSKLAEKEGIESLQDLPSIVTRGIEWKPKALSITDELNAKCSYWKDKIIYPNEPRGDAVVSQKAFSDSLDPILNNSMFSMYDEKEIVEMLSRYWGAISELWPEAFDSPKEYIIQRTTGVFVMNKLFPSVIQFCIDSKGRSLPLTKDVLKRILSKMKRQIGNKYWRAKDGRAGLAGTSKKGMYMLLNELREMLAESHSAKKPQAIRPFRL